MPVETSEHVVDGHKYRLTHFVEKGGRRTGRGFVEVQETIQRKDFEDEVKWRKTGGSYGEFLRQMAETERKELKKRQNQLDADIFAGKYPEGTTLADLEPKPKAAPKPQPKSKKVAANKAR